MRLDFLTTVIELNSCIVFVAVVIVDALIYTVIFLTGPPLKMSLDWPPPKFAWTGPPLNFLGVGIIFTSPDT